MTLTTTTARNSYLASGIAGPYPYNFRIFQATDLVVETVVAGIVTELSYPADFSVSGVGNITGGSITLTAALASGSLVIRRARPQLQQLSLRSHSGGFDPASFENQLDDIVMMIQEQQDGIDRSLRLRPTLDPTLYNLELPDPVAGQVLVGTGSGFTMAILDSSAIALPGESRTTTTISAYTFNNRLYNILDYSAVGDGVTNNSVFIQNAINAAHNNPRGGTVRIPPGQFICNTALTLYANVAIVGDDFGTSILVFPLGTDGLILEAATFNTDCQQLRNLYISGPGVFPGTLTAPQQADALTSVGVKLRNTANLRLDRVFVTNFGVNLRCRDWDHVTLDGCKFGGYRGTGSVVFGDVTSPDGSGYLGSTSNGIFAHNCWVSCGAGSNGLLNTGAAVQIDRATMVQWIGGTIESGGVGMKLAATNNGADGFRCSSFTLIGVDFENCKGKYIEVGTAESSVSPALSGLTLIDVNGSLAGSTNTTVGASIRNVRDFRAHGHGFVLGGAGAAYWDFVGVNNHPNVEIGPAFNYALAGGVYMRVNGVATSATVDERVISLPTYGSDARAVNRIASIVAERITVTDPAYQRGSAVFASGVAQSIFAPGAITGQFLIIAQGVGAGSANFHARAWFVSTNIYNALYDNVSGSPNFVVSNSAGNVSITQTSGANMTVNWTILRFTA